jgi:hypothetical protein
VLSWEMLAGDIEMAIHASDCRGRHHRSARCAPTKSSRWCDS